MSIYIGIKQNLCFRWSLWAECIFRPLRSRCVQKRRHVCQPTVGWVHVPVSTGGVREALLWDDHPQLPRSVLHHLQRPEAEIPLHRLLHVSSSFFLCAFSFPPYLFFSSSSVTKPQTVKWVFFNNWDWIKLKTTTTDCTCHSLHFSSCCTTIAEKVLSS